MTSKEDILLVMEVSEYLLEFADMNHDDITRSDYQGISEAKAMDIIKLIRSKK